MPAYSSQYYDPNKAHDYYMKNRELKGYENRYGGSRGPYNTAHKSANQNDQYSTDSAAYNEQLKQRQQSMDSENRKTLSDLKTNLNQYKQDEKDYVNSLKDSISSLRQEIKEMSKEDRRFNSEPYRDKIFELQQEIREIRSTRDERTRAFREQIKDAKQAQADERQRLRQQTKGGSTSGFNQKGKEAAEYIKKQMETERDTVVAKINKETDDQMLDKVSRLKDQINKARSKGTNYSAKQFLARVNSMLGETKKTKMNTTKKHKEAYKTKYKQEIDKLRSDDSMFSYWDKREAKVAERARKDRLWSEKNAANTELYNTRKKEYEDRYQTQKNKRQESLDKYIERQRKKAEREQQKAERGSRKRR